MRSSRNSTALLTLEELIQLPPDRKSWRFLMSHFYHWKDASALAAAVEFVEPHLERWPPEWRTLTPHLAHRIAEGKFPIALRLVRWFDLTEVNRYTARQQGGPLYSYWHQMSPEILQCLLASDVFPSPYGLRMGRYVHGKEICAAIALHCQGLQELKLDCCRLDDQSISLLAYAPNLSQIKRLNLHHNYISDQGLLTLYQSPYLHQVEYLNLYANPGCYVSASRLAPLQAARQAPQWAKTKIIC